MRVMWTTWDLDDIADAADAEGHAGLTALGAPEHPMTETLPYHGAFADYRLHVTACRTCLFDLAGCAEGDALLEVSQVGVAEQHRAAALN